MLEREFSVADFQHVGIVPAAHARVLIKFDGVVVKNFDPRPYRADIGGCAPQIARVSSPLIRLIEAPFAN